MSPQIQADLGFGHGNVIKAYEVRCACANDACTAAGGGGSGSSLCARVHGGAVSATARWLRCRGTRFSWARGETWVADRAMSCGRLMPSSLAAQAVLTPTHLCLVMEYAQAGSAVNMGSAMACWHGGGALQQTRLAATPPLLVIVACTGLPVLCAGTFACWCCRASCAAGDWYRLLHALLCSCSCMRPILNRICRAAA